jgi:hypothetical protein
LHEIHTHLFQRYALLHRIISARELHRTRFCKSKLDYGDQRSIDQLKGHKFTVLHALEKLERRTAEVNHHQQTWYQWVRAIQDAEVKARENEKTTVEREVKLFSAHWQELKPRLDRKKHQESERRNNPALEEANRKRMKRRS